MKKKDLERRLAIIEEKLGIVNETLKLEAGKWYKYPNHENWKLCITSIDGNDVGGYGVDLNGGWMRSGKWDVYADELDKLIECTPQEVKEALEKEAKRRYKVGDKIECLVSRMPSIITEPPYVSTSSSVNALTDCLSSGYICLFQNGNWAEVIEQPTDKFAELKEAHKDGAVIQFKNSSTFGKWLDLGSVVAWNPHNEYRIKPEEKPKVGDVVKAWDDQDDEFMIGILNRIDSGTNTFPYVVSNNGFKHARTVTKEEVIKLLFGDE